MKHSPHLITLLFVLGQAGLSLPHARGQEATQVESASSISDVPFPIEEAKSGDSSKLGAWRFPAADSSGVEAFRDSEAVYLRVDPNLQSLNIPRLAAPLYAVRWVAGEDRRSTLALKPEQEEWLISWKARPAEASWLVVALGAAPRLVSEIEPVNALGDGTFVIPGHLGITSGEKIRYEPQTYKNTVGYWVGAKDNVVFKINVEVPGAYNVGILQGCGKGQGGSQARISLSGPTGEQSDAVDFDVLETGHFQNFQWRHIGVLEISTTGVHELKVAPVKIANKALMDVRMLQLTRLPGGKK